VAIAGALATAIGLSLVGPLVAWRSRSLLGAWRLTPGERTWLVWSGICFVWLVMGTGEHLLGTPGDRVTAVVGIVLCVPGIAAVLRWFEPRRGDCSPVGWTHRVGLLLGLADCGLLLGVSLARLGAI
jgi:hypothetical protein